MNSGSPLYNLILFFVLAAVVYLLFRPIKGWFWIIKNSFKQNEKTVIEDILKLLYHFENKNKHVTIHNLTRSLKFNDNDIIEAVKKMSLNQLIKQDGEVLNLSNEGRDYALRIIRVHRLWEKYLAEKTGYDKKEWHDRAEDMEHKLSLEETNILATQLGQPMFDPHGDPIPTHHGHVAEVKGDLLSTVEVGSVGRITHIEDEPDVIYKQILAENIHIGSQIRVVENNMKRVIFHSEGEEFILAPVVASSITVEILEKEEEHKHDLVRLTNLKMGESAKVLGISKECRGEARRRLLDLGFVKGTPIEIELESPLKNPKAYLVKGSSIALRDDQASKILIKKD